MSAKNIRAALAADPELGAGNVLVKVIEHGADLDGPGITFDVEVDGLVWALLGAASAVVVVRRKDALSGDWTKR